MKLLRQYLLLYALIASLDGNAAERFSSHEGNSIGFTYSYDERMWGKIIIDQIYPSIENSIKGIRSHFPSKFLNLIPHDVNETPRCIDKILVISIIAYSERRTNFICRYIFARRGFLAERWRFHRLQIADICQTHLIHYPLRKLMGWWSVYIQRYNNHSSQSNKRNRQYYAARGKSPDHNGYSYSKQNDDRHKR